MKYNNCLDYAVRAGTRGVNWPVAKQRAYEKAITYDYCINKGWTALAAAIINAFLKGGDNFVLDILNNMFYGTPFSVHAYTPEGIHIHDDPFAGELAVIYLAQYDPDTGWKSNATNDVHFFRTWKKSGNTKGVASSADKKVRFVKLTEGNRFIQPNQMGYNIKYKSGSILSKYILYDHGID